MCSMYLCVIKLIIRTRTGTRISQYYHHYHYYYSHSRSLQKST